MTGNNPLVLENGGLAETFGFEDENENAADAHVVVSESDYREWLAKRRQNEPDVSLQEYSADDYDTKKFRFDCLELALSTLHKAIGAKADPDNVIDLADKYFAYITTGKKGE